MADRDITASYSVGDFAAKQLRWRPTDEASARMFTVSGVLGVAITTAAWTSRSCRRLSVVSTASGSEPVPA